MILKKEKELGLSQNKLAKTAGRLTQSFMNEIESGRKTPSLDVFFGSARNCRSKSFPTSPKGRRGPGPCAGTHTVRPPSVRMRPDAGIGPCGVRASPCLCVGGGACPRPPVPGLRCAAGVISRPARAIESLWRKNAPSSVTASPCHLPPRRRGRLFGRLEAAPT
ncbi:MAG: helix-turn-helix transcriptional regulator [Eubacteriales bacterium]